MKVAVLDTSALIRLFVPDGPLPEGLEELVALALRAEAVLYVPGMALAEAAQVLRKKEKAGYLTASEADEILQAVLELPLELISERALVTDALALSRGTGLTVYDALFVALAQKKRGELVTGDAEVARAWGRARRAP